MLEKIGLPPKPSQRGNNWVVDASHCQGCSSQFTFINRKHHCRRCGGLFCHSCTSHRMVLRGQGDSPVRICEPCKTLEEAARFEMRYGNRSRVGKASSKSTLKSENEILSDILGNDKKESFVSRMGSSSRTVSSVERATSLNAQDAVALDGGEKVQRTVSAGVFDRQISEKEPTSPEDLRQQAVEEKKKYRVLKGEGKSDEALRAFKRGKELERQADALEISLRRSRRKALVSQDVEEVQIKEDGGGSRRGNKVARLDGEEKDDLVSELRELGWSDMDLHSEDKKRTNTSLEGEFSSLLGEISEKTKTGKTSNPIDKSQVLVHKKKALELKREGNLAEAKEELKRAKVLEKQLEEQELLAGAEDSDDELSVLIRSMDSDSQQLSSDLYDQNHDFDISNLLGAADQVIGGNFDVTDEDMEDPEIAAALSSLGWADDSDSHESNIPRVVDKEALSNEILSLKREALTQKRAGNVSEAMSLLKKAKLLEKDLESFESEKGEFAEEHNANVNATKEVNSKPTPRKTKLMIQKELIGLKKKALALKREGRFDEAEEELRKGKILEQELEEMDRAPLNPKAMPEAISTTVPNLAYDNLPAVAEEDENVTDHDMNDPAYLSLLKSLGWQEEHNDHPAQVSSDSSKRNDTPVPQAVPVVGVARPRKSKAELQRELLGLKRRALMLRRQGESEEAEEVLSKAKEIEAQIAEMEQPVATEVQHDISTENKNKSADKDVDDDAETVTEKDMHDPSMLSILKNLGWNGEEQETLTTNEKRNENAAKSVQSDATSVTVKKRSKGEIQRELLNLKRKALALRRKGETEAADEVLNAAKVLEVQLEELETPKQVNLPEGVEDEKPNEFGSGSNSEIFETPDHGIRNSDLLIHLTSPLVESTTVSPPSNSGNLIDLLTGDDWGGVSQMPAERHENAAPHIKKPLTIDEHASVVRKDVAATEKLEKIAQKEKPRTSEANPAEGHETNIETGVKQEILARKRKAVALKREGKLAEAREELRQAKLLEKRSSQDDASPTHEPVAASNASSPVANQKEHGSPSTISPSTISPSTVSLKPLSSRERFKLQQESLSHKRQAMKLRREGRTEEADAELDLARSLEARLEESSSHDPTSGTEADGDLGVEDFLDPQLLSALRAIGIDDTRAAPRAADQPQPSKPNATAAKIESPHRERVQLEEQIKAEKLKALHLKRSGKQAEALDVLRNAKLLEKKLNSLS